jgi:ceramide glucosyltransferase
VTALVGLILLSVAAAYCVLIVVALLAWRRARPGRSGGPLPPVSLLKPLCGAEPGLYDHLRAFCVQEYPVYQIVFGVRDPADPARAVVERLCAEFPSLDITMVVNPALHGSNFKVSNLINILAEARHDLLVMADSDSFVGPDYLSSVTAPLFDRSVGLVTCPYYGVPTSGVWSRLGAMYINEWYVPSVLLAWLFGYRGYVSGQTMCLRRDTLEAIGGLHAIADHLADDHRIGELVAGLGLQIFLCPYLVEGEHHEQSFDSLVRHELRWMRTIRILRPLSFRFIFLSFSLPLAVCGVALAAPGGRWTLLAWSLFALTATMRLMLHRLAVQRRPALPADTWLVPVRDLLLCWIWWRSFATSRVLWRGEEFDVDGDGHMRRLG